MSNVSCHIAYYSTPVSVPVFDEANLLRAFLVFLFQHFDQFQRRRQEHSSNCSRIFRSSANYTHLVMELKIDVMNES